MKRNMQRAMDRLGIDSDIRALVERLWKHCYSVRASCQGHDREAYFLFTGGDGWFENKAQHYGLSLVPNRECCQQEFRDEVLNRGLDPSKYSDQRKCCGCGAGVNGYTAFRGVLKHFN